jgi:hypothetical protein
MKQKFFLFLYLFLFNFDVLVPTNGYSHSPIRDIDSLSSDNDEIIFDLRKSNTKSPVFYSSRSRPSILKIFLKNVTANIGDKVNLKCPSVLDRADFLRNKEFHLNEYFKIKTVQMK